MADPFVHLHTHTGYSLLDGMTGIQELVEKVEKDNAPAVAITDHGTAAGTIKLVQACNAAGIKAIPGIEAYHANDITKSSRTSKTADGDTDRDIFHMILLAKSNEGYHNLLRVTSDANIYGKSKKPRMDDVMLEKYSEGLIGTSGCLSSRVSRKLLEGDYQEALEMAAIHRDILGKENYFIEIQNHMIPEQLAILDYQVRMAKDLGVGLLATNDSHYTHAHQASAHETLLCIGTKSTLNNPDRFKFDGDHSHYVKSAEEMQQRFPNDDFPNACSNTLLVAEMCDVNITLNDTDHHLLPDFDIPEEDRREIINLRTKEEESDPKWSMADAYLRSTVEKNAEIVYGNAGGEVPESVTARLNYELSTISDMGFSDYFLILADVTRWARENGVLVGPARGCLAPGTQVATENGYVNIEDIVVGDVIYDETGAKVATPEVFAYDCEEKLVKITSTNGSLSMTADHKVLINRNDEAQWVRADEVKIGDFVVEVNCYSILRWYQHFHRVTNISLVDNPTGKVYDFTVPTTNSYMTNAFIVHNSAAGSIVSYLAKITAVDPLEHGLMFERFLNPGRRSMPDIDVDFDPTRIHEVINYLVDTYGEECVSLVATYSYLKVKSSIKDAARAMGLPHALSDEMCKTLDDKSMLRFRGNLADLFSESPREKISGDDDQKRIWLEAEPLREITRRNKDAAAIAKQAIEIEGTIKGTGEHAAAVLLTPTPLTDHVPVRSQKKLASTKKNKVTESEYKKLQVLVSEYDKDDVEAIGGLKLDLLSIMNLPAIKRAVDLVERDYGVKLDLDNLPLDDKKVFELLGRADTDGVFQLGSTGIKDLLKRMQPKSFKDISALLALYRPGPMGSDIHLSYADRLNGRERVTYFHPDAKEILGETLGECVTGDTLVTMGDGTQSSIDEIKEKMRLRIPVNVMAIADNGDPISSPVTHFMNTGVKEIVRIETNSGKVLKVSRDHPVLTGRGWVKAEFLKEDDQVASPLAPGEPTTRKLSTYLEKCGNNNDYFYAKQNWTKIKSIEFTGEFEEMYDITVKDHHNFIANGVIVHNCIYQEQIMSIAQKFAGFSLAEADDLRSVMGKKKLDKLEQMQGDFKQGMIDNGYKGKLADSLWDMMLPFSSYAFNKSHSVGYAVVSYWTAYLKANYPEQFMAACIDFFEDEKRTAQVDSARGMGIDVIAPDINKSEIMSSSSTKAIWLGLNTIKSCGEVAVKGILEEREARGDFQSLIDFCARMATHSKVSQAITTSLIQVGAFDSLHDNRKEMIDKLEFIINEVKKESKKTDGTEDLDFGLFDNGGVETVMNIDIPLGESLVDYSDKEKLDQEFNKLGFFVREHPVKRLKSEGIGIAQIFAEELYETPEKTRWFIQNPKVDAVGVLLDHEVKQSKKTGSEFTNFTIDSGGRRVKCVAFYAVSKDLQGEIVHVIGNVKEDTFSDNDDDENTLVNLHANKVELFDEENTVRSRSVTNNESVKASPVRKAQKAVPVARRKNVYGVIAYSDDKKVMRKIVNWALADKTGNKTAVALQNLKGVHPTFFYTGLSGEEAAEQIVELGATATKCSEMSWNAIINEAGK